MSAFTCAVCRRLVVVGSVCRCDRWSPSQPLQAAADDEAFDGIRRAARAAVLQSCGIPAGVFYGRSPIDVAREALAVAEVSRERSAS